MSNEMAGSAGSGELFDIIRLALSTPEEGLNQLGKIVHKRARAFLRSVTEVRQSSQPSTTHQVEEQLGLFAETKPMATSTRRCREKPPQRKSIQPLCVETQDDSKIWRSWMNLSLPRGDRDETD